ncbi:ABC transporter ATP-binding protein [uncultured Desulfobacter sp.]|uniref:ABC transporter ATP-binding protein n=1 Tax=uncultured Desulfobacter sp. TaxID=240139 RepID=UPI0029F49115|nr:ABC transporter ATP-binding protein [uncultured Desulfobacter sp.]
MADTMNQMNDDVLVRCEHVSKKFCRGLKRSLWYGVQDICAEINPRRKNDMPPGKGNIPELRKDEFWAVNDISFELKRGECLGLIGHNGAGKSTLLKMLNGLIKPDHGRITMKGRIGALIELNAGFNPILTGRENIYIYGSILGFSKREINEKYDAIVEFAELKDFMETPVRSYSSGMKVRLGFAVAAQMEPDVLIIDEVLAVGDVGFRTKCFSSISELLKNSAVILVSHAMSMVSRYSTELILMAHGTLIEKTTNVPVGIEKYYELNCTSEFPEIIERGVVIKGLELNEQSVAPNQSLLLAYADKFNFKFKLFFNENLFFLIRITLINSEGQVVAVAQTDCVNIDVKEGILSVRLPQIYLKSGDYNVTISFRDKKDLFNISYYSNYFKIKITGGYNDFGAAFISFPTEVIIESNVC